MAEQLNHQDRANLIPPSPTPQSFASNTAPLVILLRPRFAKQVTYLQQNDGFTFHSMDCAALPSAARCASIGAGQRHSRDLGGRWPGSVEIVYGGDGV